MKIVFVNPPYGKDFVRSARWAAKSRGRVQRHPENALIALGVLREAGNEVFFVEGAARNLSKKEILSQINVLEEVLSDAKIFSSKTLEYHINKKISELEDKINKK